MDLYTASHLIVAAIRISEHRQGTPPSVEAVSEMISFSPEQTNRLCKRLNELGIIEWIEGGFGNRLFVRDHTKIETIPAEKNEGGLEEEIKKFQSQKKDFKQEIEVFQSEKQKRQKDLFAELENKLKKGLTKDNGGKPF